AGTRLAAAPLTLDHRPDRPDEMVRVQALGARVEYFRYADGTLGQLPRLFADQAEGPGLPLSRGIGFCDPLAAKAGVVPEPEVSMRRLTRADRFVVLGSDGLWASLSAAEAVAVVEQVAGSVMWGGSVGADEEEGGAEAREAAERAAAASGPGGRPRLPPLSDAASAVHVSPAPIGGESVAWAAADGGPVTGMGGGASAGAVPARGCSEAKQGEPGTGTWLAADWDLAELLLPEPVRLARQLRLRRLAAAAAEALCAASLENDRMRRDRRGRRDDVTAIVLWLDHPPKAP
ncbi:unnamed protein product, partial [Symbiodinium sp. KB8]